MSIDEQINSDNFLKLCDYIYSPHENYIYVNSVIKKYPHLKMFSPNNHLVENGIIYVGMCTLLEECFKLMPSEGNFIVIHRDNDRSFTQSHYAFKKPSVKHIYSINCEVMADDVTAIPYGIASINGDNQTLYDIQCESIQRDRHVFCRMNVNPNTQERIRAVSDLLSNGLVNVVTSQIKAEEFYRCIKSHRFNMSLQGEGKDTMRTWESLFLGAIPIVSNCSEMRHFEDMPLVYYNREEITQHWIDSIDVSGKSLKRACMSYWKDEILKRRAEL